MRLLIDFASFGRSRLSSAIEFRARPASIGMRRHQSATTIAVMDIEAYCRAIAALYRAKHEGRKRLYADEGEPRRAGLPFACRCTQRHGGQAGAFAATQAACPAYQLRASSDDGDNCNVSFTIRALACVDGAHSQ